MSCSWISIISCVVDGMVDVWKKCRNYLDESDENPDQSDGSKSEENDEGEPVRATPLQAGMMSLDPKNCSFVNCNFGIDQKVSTAQPLLERPLLAQSTPASVVSAQSSDAPSSLEQNVLEWVPATIKTAHSLADRAVIGGYDIDRSNLWIIRADISGELIFGKLNDRHELAFAPYKKDDTYAEQNVEKFDVCCYKTSEARKKVRWIKSSKGQVPLNAFVAGWKANGENLYIGRARHDAENYPGYHTLCPGMIQPSHGVLYITYNHEVYTISPYEVLCFVEDEYH